MATHLMHRFAGLYRDEEGASLVEYVLLVALIGGLIEARRLGHVLLLHPMARVVVGVLVALSVAARLAVHRGVAQVQRPTSARKV